jgi:hypothetical protein
MGGPFDGAGRTWQTAASRVVYGLMGASGAYAMARGCPTRPSLSFARGVVAFTEVKGATWD